MKIAILLILTLLISPATALKVNPRHESSYTCYDYSIQFTKENPDWGIVTLSDNQWFRGISHMVNYKVTVDGLQIHDGLYDRDYIIYNWENAHYYHFWLNGETPLRNYRVMQDNSHLIKN